MNKPLQSLALVAIVSACLLVPQVSRGAGNDNPTGVTGEYNGSITTAGSVDPYTGNAKRTVDDLTVTGGVGAYPLEWKRMLNTRQGSYAGFGPAGAWMHNYHWGLWLRPWRPYHYYDTPYEGPDGQVIFPDGRSMQLEVTGPDNHFYQKGNTGEPMGRVEQMGGGNYDLIMNDGGRVKFEPFNSGTGVTDFRAKKIVDPHGLVTTLSHDANGRLVRVTEPAGRYLQINYSTFSYPAPPPSSGTLHIKQIGSVQAFASEGNLTETVNYSYTMERIDYGYRNFNLTKVNYDDGTQATYTYVPDNSVNGLHGGRMETCRDVRYAGPMSNIKYEYMVGTPGVQLVAVGQVKRERNLTTGQALTEILYPNTHPQPSPYDTEGWRRVLRRHERRPDGTTREFQYDGWAELESYTDFKGQRSYLAYGGGIGYGAGLGYTTYGRIATDARGNQVIIEKDGRTGNVRSTKRGNNPNGPWVKYEYTDNFYPYWVSLRRDERGNEIKHQRDASNRIWRTDYPDGGVEQFTYNHFGQVLTHLTTSGGTDTFTYDHRGLKTTSYPQATWSDPHPGNHPTRYEYYSYGPHTDRLSKVIDPRGNVTSYQYNLRGQVTKVTHQDGTYTQSGYNPDGTLAWTADENHPNASWNESERTRYTYDEYKRVLTVKNLMNETTTNNYAIDVNWAQPLLHTTNNIKYTLSPLGKTVVFDYDENYRKSSQVQALGTADEAWTLFEYDEVGNLKRTTDPRFNVTTFEYDDRNRKIWMDSPIASDRNSNGHTMEWQYDDAGNKTRETRADDAFRSWDYDKMNRISHAYDWRTNEVPELHQTTTYTRNATGSERTIKDAKGAVYSFAYDVLGRKMCAAYPPAAGNPNPIELFWYDEVGNLKQYQNPAGQTKHLSYDNRNRLIDVRWDGDVAPITGTQYDAASRITKIETPETGIHYGYNDANRVIREDQILLGAPTRRIEKAPDADGNPTQLLVTTNGGMDFFVHYDYTQRNQLAHITQNDYSPLYTYAYDRAGNMTMRRGDILGDATNVPSNTYDALNRPTYWEQTGGGNVPFEKSHYQYDKVGREVATWREEDWKGERFTYNVANHLTRAEYKADNVWTTNTSGWERFRDYHYTPDLLNWTSVNDNGYLATLEHNDLNQYTSINGFVPGYDANFNQITTYYGPTFVYDALNRAVGGSMQATYDGLGRCLRRTIGGNTIVYAYDGWKPVTEYDGAGNLSARNIYGPGPDEILMRGSGFGWFFYHSDKQGSVSALVGLGGNVVEKYIYDAFGRPEITDRWGNPHYDTSSRYASLYGNRFMFTGREWFPELHVYDYRHRLYNPDNGRFLQTDPIGFDAGDMNLFRYCSDDPVNRTDPLGLDWGFFADQYPINFDNISDVPTLSKGANGYTARPIFSAVASIVPAGEGHAIKYADVNIRSQSYIRTHQRRTVGTFPTWKKQEDRLTGDNLVRTTKHEGRQKGIDQSLYNKWHGDGTFKRMIEGDKIYSSPGKAGEALRQNEKSAKDTFETARRKLGRDLQNRDGLYQPSHFVPSSAPSAAEVDAAHQATGVPSQAAEAVNFVRGVR